MRDKADKLTQSLNRRGVRAKVMGIESVPEIALTIEYSMTDEQRAALDKVRSGAAVGMRQRSHAFRAPGPQRVVMRPLILLGDPAQNRWLKDIHDLHLVRRALSPSYPGTGRALVQYVWSPFYDGFDALTISANDAAGVNAGIASLPGAGGATQ